MKGLKKKTTTQSQETLRSILDIMKEVAKKKKTTGDQMEMHTPLQMPAQKEDPGKMMITQKR